VGSAEANLRVRGDAHGECFPHSRTSRHRSDSSAVSKCCIPGLPPCRNMIVKSEGKPLSKQGRDGGGWCGVQVSYVNTHMQLEARRDVALSQEVDGPRYVRPSSCRY
jgi:hypothetical protein